MQAATAQSGQETTLRGFARIVRVSDYVIRKAVATGRIPATLVGHNEKGWPIILDVEAAKREFLANARKPTKTGALADDQRLMTQERTRALKMENDRKAGKLIDAGQAERDGFEAARILREQVLNVSARISAELAAESDPFKVQLRLDAELRLALEATSRAIAS